MGKKNTFRDMMVVGFALFAMFFGAGNLIFPPKLGFNSGDIWEWGFVSFMLADIGLSVLALMVIAKNGRGSEGITDGIGRKMSSVLLAINMICLAPLIVIPRTAATTFELAVEPVMPSAGRLIISIIFFAIVLVLSIRESKIVDIVGAIMAPVMFVALIALIVVGVATPLGSIEKSAVLADVVREGVLAGYQAMDMMGAILIAVVVIASVIQKGYGSVREQHKIIGLSSIVCAIALGVVYGGLTYLGASASSVLSEDLTQAQLLVAVTRGLLGQGGVILLGVIVTFACLTTAIGVTSSFAAFFTKISNDKLKYEYLVVGTCVFSCVISNFGISAIVSFAAPILELIYPVLVTLLVLSAFSGKVKRGNIHKAAAIGAFIASALCIIENYTGFSTGMSHMPFASFGFAWVIPTAVFAVIGSFIKPKNKGNETEEEA